MGLEFRGFRVQGLKSLKGGHLGDSVGVKGDTRSLDYSSYTGLLIGKIPDWGLQARCILGERSSPNPTPLNP